MSLFLRTSKTLLISPYKRILLSHCCSSSYSRSFRYKTKYSNPNQLTCAGFARPHQTRCSSFNKVEEAKDFTSSAKPDGPSTVYLQQLQNLDYDARHAGKLQQAKVEKLFKAMKETGNVESFGGLLIIRCCGALIPEMPAELRTRLVQDIWSTLPKLNCQYDVSHYNALLKVYLENEHKFDTVDFINSMKQQGVEPNRVTYQNLFSIYCQQGDVEGAKNILEFMKSKDLTINEQIFNDLIFGHAKSNDMESAKEVLEVMKNAQLLPSSATYCALACGYALMGDIENVLTTIAEMEQSCPLQDKIILKIIYTLAITQHGDVVQQVIPKLQFQNGYNNKCISTVLELVNKGHHQIACILQNTISRTDTNEPCWYPFIMQVVKQGLKPEVVIDCCTSVSKGNENELKLALLKAAETALHLKKIDDALVYFKEGRSLRFPLRSHYFWPIFILNKENEQGIYDTLKLMLDMQCPADFDTFVSFTFPYISINDPHAFVAKLQDFGYNLSDILNPLSARYVERCDLHSAVQLLKYYSGQCKFGLLPLSWLVTAYIKTEDTTLTVQLLELYEQNSMKSEQDNEIYEKFMVQLLSSPECKTSLVESLLLTLKEKNKKISASVLEKIYRMKGSSVSKITSVVQNLNSTEAPVSEHRKIILDQKGNEHHPSEFYRSLQLHIKNKDVECVKALLHDLDGRNFVFKSSTYAALVQLFCNSKDLDRAMYYKLLLDKEFPDFLLPCYVVLKLASLLAENKKFDDAEHVIFSYHTKFGSYTSGDVFNLLNEFAKSEDTGRTRRLFEKLVDLKFCVPSKAILGPLIRTYILQNDLHRAVEEYLRIVKTYQFTPLKLEILTQLVQHEDHEMLQKVYNATASVTGEALATLDLVQAFIVCGQTTQAAKVIKASTAEITERSVNCMCENYVKLNKANELETFIQITKGIPGLDREYMYYQLLKAYVNTKNVEKSLDIWHMMQEEDVLPSNRTMHCLGTFLQEMSQPLPFQIPQLPSSEKHTEENASLMALSSLQASQAIAAEMEKDNLQNAVRLIAEMLSAHIKPELDVVHQLAKRLHVTGDFRTLSHLEAILPSKLSKRLPFKDYLTKCLKEKGSENEFLKNLEKDISTHKRNFPLTSFWILLSEKPQLLRRVQVIADTYYQEGILEPRNFYWMHLMKTKRFQEADEIFWSTPEMQKQLVFKKVIDHVKKTNDVEISHKLLDIVKETKIPSQDKSVVYSAHINALITLQRIEEALAFFKESQRILNLEQLSNDALHHLEDHLNTTGNNEAFTIQNKRKNKEQKKLRSTRFESTL